MEEHQERRKLKMTFETMMEGLQLATSNLNFVYVFVNVLYSLIGRPYINVCTFELLYGAGTERQGIHRGFEATETCKAWVT